MIVVNNNSLPQLEAPASVLVLLSTYNGEAFIRPLIDSVLAQEDVEVHLLIRDDGSSDAPLDILHEYEQNNPNIEVYTGKNLGFIGSFNDLLASEKADSFDYLAFCDQDDIWLPDKLSCGVRALKTQDEHMPLVYSCAMTLIDEHDKPFGMIKDGISRYTYKQSAVTPVGYGCKQIFNQAARRVYLQVANIKVEAHDWFLTILCQFLGQVLYDPTSHILYRQHSNNTVGASGASPLQAVVKLKKRGTHTKSTMFESLQAIAPDNLSPEAQDVIKTMVHAGHPINRLKLFFDPCYIGFNSSSTRAFKIRALLGWL